MKMTRIESIIVNDHITCRGNYGRGTRHNLIGSPDRTPTTAKNFKNLKKVSD